MKKISAKNIIKNIKKLPPKFIVLVLIIIILLSTIITIIIVQASKQKAVIYTGDNLNENKYPQYKELLDKLKEEHPNWTFTLFYTKLNWSSVIKNEGHSNNRTTPLNLIPHSKNYSGEWQCEEDNGKTYDNGSWLCASTKAIAYKMDPRNILNSDDIFQLKELNFNEDATTKEGIMDKTEDTFLEGESLAEAILDAGKKNDIDPYFIVSRLIQEQGKNGTKLSRGYEYNGQTVYNPFNIAASGNSQTSIINNAAEYAYSHKWFSLEKALIEGVNFINIKYMDIGQDTLYFQKFDVIKENELYTNQYMQNLLAPTSESDILLDQYKSSNTVDSKLNFIIPLYENMPKEISEKPKKE